MPKNATKKQSCWYKLSAYREGGVVAEYDGHGVYLRQRFFDSEGEQILVVCTMPDEGMPKQAIQHVLETLTLAELSPTVILGPNVDMLRLEKMTSTMSTAMEAEYLAARNGAGEGGA